MQVDRCKMSAWGSPGGPLGGCIDVLQIPVRDIWVFKRNYTFSITDSGICPTVWWDSSGNILFNDGSSRFAFPNSLWDSIVCAFNIFGEGE